MEIQVALDRVPLDQAVQITGAVAPLVDWVEFGTSLVKHYGLAGLRAVVDAAGATPVLADLKTVDDAEFELTLAYEGGARSATVLGLAPQVTIDTALEVSRAAQRELVIDLMGLSGDEIRGLTDRLPPYVLLAPHVSKDAQNGLERPADLLGAWATGRRIALAGGLTAADLPDLADWPDLRVVVGSAVTKSNDPVGAVRELRRAAGKEENPDAS